MNPKWERAEWGGEAFNDWRRWWAVTPPCVERDAEEGGGANWCKSWLQEDETQEEREREATKIEERSWGFVIDLSVTWYILSVLISTLHINLMAIIHSHRSHISILFSYYTFSLSLYIYIYMPSVSNYK
jgi:bisphosphoglycerate-dependent phosphoglycerate mutase